MDAQACIKDKGGAGVNDRDSQIGHNFMRKKLQILQFYALSICDGFNGPWNTWLVTRSYSYSINIKTF